MKQVTPTRKPRYGIVKTCVVSLYRPVAAVGQADHLPMLKAGAVHLIGGVMVLGVAFALMVWDNAYFGYYIELSLRDSFDSVSHELLRLLRRPTNWLALAFMVVLIEFGWWLLALITMSWGAQDEHFRISHRRALHRLYLLTPHLAVIVAVTGSLILWLDHRPWARADIFNTAEVLQMVTATAACLWTLWVVLAALGCNDLAPYCRWPARCVGCGYHLAGLERDQDCPECGWAIQWSLNQQTRPGVDAPGGVLWWLTQTWQSVRYPAALGSKMYILSPDTGHRRSLMFTIAILMLASPMGVGLFAIAANAIERFIGDGSQPGWYDDEFFLVVLYLGLGMGLLITGTMTAVLLVGSGIAGLTEGWRNDRNLMPAAVRAACYLSGFTIFWAIIFWCDLIVFYIVMELDLLTPIARKYNVAKEDIIITWHGGVILLGILIYLTQIGKATRAARYANW